MANYRISTWLLQPRLLAPDPLRPPGLPVWAHADWRHKDTRTYTIHTPSPWVDDFTYFADVYKSLSVD